MSEVVYTPKAGAHKSLNNITRQAPQHLSLFQGVESEHSLPSDIRAAEVKEDRQHGHEERMGTQTRSVHEVSVQPWGPQSVLYHHEGRRRLSAWEAAITKAGTEAPA